MKVKSLFLSVCAIAALASCSQNDDVAPGSNAGEARVTLRLKGDGVTTRAGGEEAATEEGAKVKDVTVFFFNETNFLIGTPEYKTVADASTPIVLKTSTDATQVVVVANLGKNEVAGKFKDVHSIEQLKGVVFSSITTTVGGPSTVNQTKNNLYMSGIGAVALGVDGVSGTAEVDLHFLSARINKIAISWNATESNQHYGTLAEFNSGTDKWWAIKQVYLMMSQTNSHVLPAGISSATDAWNGSFAPNGSLAFAGGLAWGTTPWAPKPTPDPVQTDGYLIKATQLPTPASTALNKIDNVLGTADNLNPWYIFENPTTSDTPTGVIVEVLWRSKENTQVESELITKYFTLYFGEKKSESANQPYLEPGKTYDITLNLKGSFKPGGNGGGGSDDPAKPSVDASISVTVNAAKWTTVDPVIKDFN